MAIGSSSRTTQDLEAMMGGSSVVGLSDGELLDRFISGQGVRSETAFEALVIRHGSMVRGVCRRALSDPTDADDAFQATFLVLVRRAGSIRVDGSLGRWLYGVSRKVSARVRADRDRRRRRESDGFDPDQIPSASFDLRKAETLSVLDDELARLSEPFRSAIILCDLGGLTQEEAASELGCPVGTIKSRLARGRERLRSRLVYRGVRWGDSTSVLAGLSFSNQTVPPLLLKSIVRSASALARSGSGLSSLIVPRSFVSFTEGVNRMMIVMPLKWLVSSSLIIGIGATGLTWFAGPVDDKGAIPVVAQATAQATRVDPAGPPVAPPINLPTESQMIAMPAYVVEPPDIIMVEVVGTLAGRPITGEHLVRPDGKISLGFYGEVYVAGLTTSEIKAKVIDHLRGYLTDEQLGLIEGLPGSLTKVAPNQSKAVLVDVASYNSKVYYVHGDVKSPGRIPITGNETVLDAIVYSGGLIYPGSKVRLIRPAPPGACCESILPVDFAAIVEKGDKSTNYQVMPRDRIVVFREPPVTNVEVTIVQMGERLKEQEIRLQRLEEKLDSVLNRLESLDKPR